MQLKEPVFPVVLLLSAFIEPLLSQQASCYYTFGLTRKRFRQTYENRRRVWWEEKKKSCKSVTEEPKAGKSRSQVAWDQGWDCLLFFLYFPFSLKAIYGQEEGTSKCCLQRQQKVERKWSMSDRNANDDREVIYEQHEKMRLWTKKKKEEAKQEENILRKRRVNFRLRCSKEIN